MCTVCRAAFPTRQLGNTQLERAPFSSTKPGGTMVAADTKASSATSTLCPMEMRSGSFMLLVSITHPCPMRAPSDRNHQFQTSVPPM
jgi:hypothetical protein